MKRFLGLVIAIAIILSQALLMMPSVVVRAHETDGQSSNSEAAVDQVSTPTPLPSYRFTTPAGYSLSLIVRRAIQLYEQQNDNIQLSPAAAMFTETNVVQRLGGRLLETGEPVKIDGDLLQEFILKSKDLSPASLAAWQVYADQANFNLGDFNPDKEPPATPSDQSNQSQPSNQNNQPANTDQKPANNSKVYWTVVGLSTFAILFYLLSGRQTKNQI